jgi:hypothetical protein
VIGTAAASRSCLFIALRQVTARTEAAIWIALAITALMFMPDTGRAILGMGYRMTNRRGSGEQK